MRGCLHTAGGGPSLRLLPRKGNELVAKKAKLTRKVHPPLLPLRRDWLPGGWQCRPQTAIGHVQGGMGGIRPRAPGAAHGAEVGPPRGPWYGNGSSSSPSRSLAVLAVRLALAVRHVSYGGGGASRGSPVTCLLGVVRDCANSPSPCGASLGWRHHWRARGGLSPMVGEVPLAQQGGVTKGSCAIARIRPRLLACLLMEAPLASTRWLVSRDGEVPLAPPLLLSAARQGGDQLKPSPQPAPACCCVVAAGGAPVTAALCESAAPRSAGGGPVARRRP